MLKISVKISSYTFWGGSVRLGSYSHLESRSAGFAVWCGTLSRQEGLLVLLPAVYNSIKMVEHVKVRRSVWQCIGDGSWNNMQRGLCSLFVFCFVFLFMLFMYYNYRLACAVQKAEVIINRTSSH